MKLHTYIQYCLLAGASLVIAPVPAALSDDTLLESWQLNRLFNPDSAELHQEQRDTVFIYAGLTDRDVSRALDENFDRIESMMFIRTVVTNEQGDPKIDPDTGKTVTEDNDC